MGWTRTEAKAGSQITTSQSSGSCDIGWGIDTSLVDRVLRFSGQIGQKLKSGPLRALRPLE